MPDESWKFFRVQLYKVKYILKYFTFVFLLNIYGS